MVIIPPGTFIMGSPETEKGRDADEGQHTVTIGYSFAVSKATNHMGSVGRMRSRPRVRRPLRGSGTPIGSRRQADPELCRPCPRQSSGCRRQLAGRTGFHPLAQRKTGKEKYRLLSESEFEYAARAGSTTVYGWGNEPSHDYANYGKDAGQDLGGKAEGRDKWEDSTSPVCSFPTNAFGLCDMYGNVYQWVEDCYEPDGARLPTDGSAVKSGNCAVRGFRSNSFESNAKILFAPRIGLTCMRRILAVDSYLGFRVAKTLD